MFAVMRRIWWRNFCVCVLTTCRHGCSPVLLSLSHDDSGQVVHTHAYELASWPTYLYNLIFVQPLVTLPVVPLTSPPLFWKKLANLWRVKAVKPCCVVCRSQSFTRDRRASRCLVHDVAASARIATSSTGWSSHRSVVQHLLLLLVQLFQQFKIFSCKHIFPSIRL